MITPLGQRQIFQTANIEAVRMSLEVSEQLQREAARKKAAEDHLAEDQDNVQEIGRSEALRTEERKGRGQQSAEEQGGEASPEEPESAESTPEGAEGHLDFLA